MTSRVLLVDDVSMFLELEKGYLQRSAVKVLTARDGLQALDVCRTERPSLLFMDLHMPNMNGAECCKAIKGDSQLKDTKVVLITSEGKDADRQLCLSAGCDSFLTKPLDRQIFIETARRLLPAIARRDQRIRCHVKAKFRAFGITLAGIITDISQHGVYVATDTEVEVGGAVEVVFALPDPIATVIQARGKVAWINSGAKRVKPSLPPGFGLELTEIADPSQKEIRRFLENDPDFLTI